MPALNRLSFGVLALSIAGPLLQLSPSASAQERAQTFTAPPRTIADVNAILDKETPDPAKRAKLDSLANAAPPAGASRSALAEFHYKRAQARAELGRFNDAIADCEKSVELSTDYVTETSRAEQFMEVQLRHAGEYKRAAMLLDQISRKLETFQRTKGRQFTLLHRLTLNHLFLGDLGRAEFYLKKNQALLAESRSWQNVDMFRSAWEANVEAGKARLLEARGRLAEAEASYTRYDALLRDAMVKSKNWPNQPIPGGYESTIDHNLAHLGRVKAKLGRVIEGEVDVRRALLSRLKAVGKYNVDTAHMMATFAYLLIEQARPAEAEKLIRSSLEIWDTLGYPSDSSPRVAALNQLAITQFSQRRFGEAKKLFQAVDEATKGWEAKRGAAMRSTWSAVFTDYFTRDVEKGIERARIGLELQKSRKGDKHFDTAMARAVLASGLTYARRDAEAIQEFRQAMPIIHGATHDDEEGDITTKLSADRRIQSVTEANMVVLARGADPAAASVESLQLAEAIRGRSVQNALEASAARAAARTPALGALARKSQDLDKQISALSGNISNMLGAAPEERDEAAMKAMQDELVTMRKERSTTRREIERKFPDFNNLVNPKPITVEEIRAALKPEESFVSFYFGRRDSFAWAVPKSGPAVFAMLPTTLADVEGRVKTIRAALEPNASTVGDIPPFDVKAAHELFMLLLKPIEAGWRPAKSLIVVTNGSLGLLPVGLLPVEPSDAKADVEPLFSSYRKVAWLARTHAVTVVPSASALRTLRQTKASLDKREPFIGFGDPYFSAEQAQEVVVASQQAGATTTRGIPIRMRALPKTASIDNAEIAQLPRLPDTSDELKSIALALETDPSRVLHLGKSANEKVVKGADLARYRIVAFATHGLVPGEINGLTQPALALTAPSIADVDGDGLLTVDEILGLRLNADWVVLSACNTGAAAGAGAEAASGLGRAFFYAGTRALLVTNWSVHSASARELVTDLFKRQHTAGGVSRAEALRQAAMALLDGKGFTDSSGKTLFTYGHPLFWAPYTIIGDGG